MKLIQLVLDKIGTGKRFVRNSQNAQRNLSLFLFLYL